jgi:hypothetical protein
MTVTTAMTAWWILSNLDFPDRGTQNCGGVLSNSIHKVESALVAHPAVAEAAVVVGQPQN